MIAASVIILVLIVLAIIGLYIPGLQRFDVYQFLEFLTGFIFSLGIALGIVALSLSAILFILAGGNLRMTYRSRFWLLFAVTVIGIGGLIWTVFRLIQQIGT
ncbi:MAG: hypothetical protein HY001_03175 [Candidatus Portnoybacteria bacterium]|nr:hypothetical protein [Candidatus Portnoybacteria bacterium]